VFGFAVTKIEFGWTNFG